MKHLTSTVIGFAVFIGILFFVPVATATAAVTDFDGTTTVRCSDKNVSFTYLKVRWKKTPYAYSYHVVLTDMNKRVLQKKRTKKPVTSFKNLKKGTKYRIHVTPYKGNSKGKRSNVLKIKTLSNIVDRRNVLIIGDSIQEDKNKTHNCYFVKRACDELGANPFAGKTTGVNSRNDSYGNSIFPYLSAYKPKTALRSIERRITKRKSIRSCVSANGPRFNNKPIDFSKYDVVIIAAGTNDYHHSLSLRSVRSGLKRVVNHIYRQNKKIRFVFVTPIYRKSELDESGQAAKNRLGLTLQDYREELTDFVSKLTRVKKHVISGTRISNYARICDSKYSRDGLHPNAKYSKELARSFAGKIRSLY